MKQYTTPTITVELSDEIIEMLPTVQAIKMTIEGEEGEVDKEVTVSGNKVSATLTQQDTVSIGVGTVKIEITIKDALGNVFKSRTMKTKMNEAVRDRVM